MSEKKPQIDPDHQGQLLSLVGSEQVVAAESFPHDGPQEKILGRPAGYSVTYGEEGSYKDLTERAEELQEALQAFGLRNQRVGFATASRSRRHSGLIFGRYRAHVPFVQDGAERNTSRYLSIARRSFWKATGFAALKGTGLMNDQEINTRARGMWEKFSGRYGTPINDEDRQNTARPDYIKKLGAIAKETEATKLKHAA